MDINLILIIAVLVVSAVIAIFISKPIINLLYEPFLNHLPGSGMKQRNNIIMYITVIIAVILYVILFSLNMIKL